MIVKQFLLGVTSIMFVFKCTECGEEIQETTKDIPEPNWDAESDSCAATMNPDSFDIECPKCSKSYIVQIGASSAGGEIYCDDLPDDTKVIL